MSLNFSQMEEEILEFWKRNKIFEKSVERDAPKGDYVFYDGPPFATGTPHYGHIVASLMKDVVPRYFTMRGFRVERRWGWDCHGLPIENIVEKELDIKSKKEIEEKIGVEKFNETCRSKVLMYADEWKKIIPRIGRWVDMDSPYKTMDLGFMESVWWVFKQLWDKGLIYEDYKAMHICPRCETTLSQSEVSQGYKDISDVSVVIKFALVDEPGAFVLAWTTTPWTLIGNTALAVGADITYIKIKNQNSKTIEERYILAKDAAEKIFSGKEYEIISEIKGKDLAGKAYEPLFPYFDTPDNHKKGFKIYAADFVTTEEGTGVVHIAPAFGEDDMNLGKEQNLPFVQHVNLAGQFTSEVLDFAGERVKPFGNSKATDLKIVNWLKENNKLFQAEEYLHSYPHCWRCDTPLLNYATSSWFVKVTAKKSRMIELARKINWVPAHIKEGRFGKWLEGAQDWSISRQRFWGSVIPVWRCQTGKSQIPNQNCNNIKVIGSIKELEELSGQKVIDLHKHIVDKITFKCEKCGGEMRRIPDVLDCWFESGSMPYAQFHYPFENKEKFEENFPAQFIAEGVDQTRCWFYYLLALSVSLFDEVPFLNVIANGIVLAEDGRKMAKRLKNYPEPDAIVQKYGADAMRYYLLTSPVMKAENLNFFEKGVDAALKKLIIILWNVLAFYKLYRSGSTRMTTQINAENILDKWIVAKSHQLIKTVTEQMNDYDLAQASRPIADFINDLSAWWLRRSRERFKKEEEKEAALYTLHLTLLTLAKLAAPFTPFIAENIYKELRIMNQESEKFEESVHLEQWPSFDEKLIDEKLLGEMGQARKIVELVHAIRAEQKIKVRQPLQDLEIQGIKFSPEILQIVLDEVNAKNGHFVEELKEEDGFVIKSEGVLGVRLNITLTDELKKEGLSREIVRHINGLRKEAGLTVKDKVKVFLMAADPLIGKVIEEKKEQIEKSVIALSLELVDKKTEVDFKHETTIGEEAVWIGILR